MKFTREEAIRNFREHWASLAITGVDGIHKNEYLERHSYSNIKHGCFLCEFVYQQNGRRNCDKCPIEWPDTNNDYPRDNHPCVLSYFGDWFGAKTPEERKRLAAIVRDLPEKVEKKESQFKPGDRVKVIDGSWSYSFDGKGTKNPECEISLTGQFEVVETGLSMPLLKPNLCKGVPDNDIIIQEIGTGKKVSIQERFLIKIEKPVPKYQVGDKVVPVSKSVGSFQSSFEREPNWAKSKGRGYFYVNHIGKENDQTVYGCGHELRQVCNSYLESDLLPYVEPKAEKIPEPEKKAEPRPFNVGDRVRVDGNHVGVVADMSYSGVGVEFTGKSPNSSQVWDKRHPNKKGKGFYYSQSRVELLPPVNHCPEPKTIVETTTFKFKGAKTTCIIENEHGRFKGAAKCSPQDEWNEERGKALSFIRAKEAMAKAGL